MASILDELQKDLGVSGERAINVGASPAPLGDLSRESALPRAVAFTPAEQQANLDSETRPGRVAEWQRAIDTEKRPEARRALQEGLDQTLQASGAQPADPTRRAAITPLRPAPPISDRPAPRSGAPSRGGLFSDLATDLGVPPDVSDLRVDPRGVDSSSWDKRPDGSAKGNGFLGLLKGADGKTMSEYSVGVSIGGKQMDVPTLVPTLTRAEIDEVLQGKVSDAVVEKAARHAAQRLKDGKPVFATPEESPGATAPKAEEPTGFAGIVRKATDAALNALRPVDRTQQNKRVANAADRPWEAARAAAQGHRDVAAEPNIREEVSRMRAANIEAEAAGRPLPHRKEEIAQLERQRVTGDALSVPERVADVERKTARDMANADFWRNMQATAQKIDPGLGEMGPLWRGMVGGFLQAYGETWLSDLAGGQITTPHPVFGTPEEAKKTFQQIAGLGEAWVAEADRRNKEITGDLKPGMGAKVADSAITSLAMMGPALAAGLLTKSPLTVVAIMSGETGAQAYGEARQEGLTPAQSGVYATLQATIEGGTEYLPMKALFRTSRDEVKWLLRFLAREVPGEMLATTLQSAVDKVSVRPEMTVKDFGEDLITTILSTPLAAGAQAGAARALRGAPKGMTDEDKEEILDKYREGIDQLKTVTDQTAKTARPPVAPTHRLDDGTPVRQRQEGGQPVAGVWETADGEIVEAPRADPITKPEANAAMRVGGVEYDVTITGKGTAKDTVRLADGQEVPIGDIETMGDEAKEVLGLLPPEQQEGAKKPVKPAAKKAAPRVQTATLDPAAAVQAPAQSTPQEAGAEVAVPQPAPQPEQAALIEPPAPPKPIYTGKAPELEGTRSLQRQNRLRGNAASVAQMSAIAENPDYDRLSASKAPESGAPMVSISADADVIPDEQMGRESVVTIGGAKVPIRYAVIEADSLLASHTAEGKERPEYFAAPESGQIRALNNGRSAGLRDAYARGTAGRYREELAADPDHGIAPEVIAKLQRPVLVRVYSDAFNSSIENIGEKSQGETLKQSPLEIALQDAAKLTPEDLEVFDPGESGDVAAASNEKFINLFLGKMTPEDRGAMVDQATQRPNKAFYDRMEAALFQKAYSSQPLTGMFAEAEDPEIRNVLRALAIAAPEMAKLDGVPAELDIRPYVADAAAMFLKAKRAKTTLDKLIKQGDFTLNALVVEFARFMSEFKNSPRKIGEGLNAGARWAQWAAAQANTADIFGDSPKYGVGDALKNIGNFMEKEYGESQVQGSGADKAAQTRAPYDAGQGAEAPAGAGGEPAGGADAGGSKPVAGNAKGDEQGAGERPVRREAGAEVAKAKLRAQQLAGFEEMGFDAAQRGESRAAGPPATTFKGRPLTPEVLRGAWLRGWDRSGMAHPKGGVTIAQGQQAAPERPKRWNIVGEDGRIIEGGFSSQKAAREHADAEVGVMYAIRQTGERGKLAADALIDPHAGTYRVVRRGEQWVVEDGATGKDGVKLAGPFSTEAAAQSWGDEFFSSSVSGQRTLQEEQAPYELAGETPEELKAKQDAEAAAAKPQREPTGKKVTADQGDLFNDQLSLFETRAKYHIGVTPEQLASMEAMVDQAYERQDPRAEDLDAQLAVMKQRSIDAAEQADLEEINEDGDYSIVDALAAIHHTLMVGRRDRDGAVDALRAEIQRFHGTPTTPEDMLEAAREAYQSRMARMQRMARMAREGSGIDAAAADATGHLASEGERQAGNYEKGHVTFNAGTPLAMGVSIENAAGTHRRPEWPALKDHYGYFKGTTAADSERGAQQGLDVFIKPGTPLNWTGPVFVVNQTHANGKFDEHKIMVGYASLAEAREGYQRNYEEGWDRARSIVPITMPAFKAWATDSTKNGPRGGNLTLSKAKDLDARHKAVPTAQGENSNDGPPQARLDFDSAIPVPGTPALAFEKVVVGSQRVGSITLPAGKVENAEQAAQAFQQLRKYPRERFQVLGLNANNEPVAYFDLFAGTLTQTMAYPREVITAVHQTPGIKSIWLAHQHPSGVAEPSNSDIALTANMNKGFRETGIEIAGHVIVAGNSAAELNALGERMRSFVVPPLGPNTQTVPMMERIIEREDLSRSDSLKSPNAARDYLRDLNPKSTGILIMDAQHRPIGWWPMSLAEMSKLRTGDVATGASRLFRMAGRNNPGAAFVYHPNVLKPDQEALLTRAVTNLAGALNLIGVHVLDAFYHETETAAGPLLKSTAEPGASYTGASNFYKLGQETTEAVRAADVRAELGPIPLYRALGNRVEVVESPYELPEDVLQPLVDDGHVSTAKALFSPSHGKIFVIASNMSRGEAATYLLHEGVGHMGIFDVLPREAGMPLLASFVDIYRSRAGDIGREARSGFLKPYRLDLRLPMHQATAAAEWIAHEAEAGKEQTLWQKIVGAVRSALRKAGLVREWSDADILHLLKLSRLSLTNANGRSVNGMPPILSRLSDEGDALTRAWVTLTQNEAMFQRPTSQATDLADIANEFDPANKVTRETWDPGDLKIVNVFKVIVAGEGPVKQRTALVTENNDGEVWIDVSNFKPGSGGVDVYQMVATYAHNNGLTFIGDPFGISPLGRLRRVEQLISSALKHRTTLHLRPPEDEGIKWGNRPEDDVQNLRNLLLKSRENVLKAFPQAEDLGYDIANGTVINSKTGAQLGRADLEALAQSPGARAASIGRTTLTRTAFSNSVLREAGRREWDELLADLVRVPGPQLGQLEASLYALRQPTGISEVYGVKDGRLLGLAHRATGSIWNVYLANGVNETLWERGSFRRMQAGSLNEVNQIFATAGLELSIVKPRNIAVPDVSIFDQNWVAPQIDNWFKRSIRYWQDRMTLSSAYEAAITKAVGPLPENAKVYREARIAHPRSATDIADFDFKNTEPLVAVMRRHRLSLKDVGSYHYALHAPERNEAIEFINPENKAGSGMTDERAQAILDGFRQRNLLTVLEQEVKPIVDRIRREREQMMIDSGLATREGILLMRQKYPNYVPLKDVVEDEFAQQQITPGFGISKPFTSAFGRWTEAQAEFILPGLIAQAKGTIAAAENAEVLRALLRQMSFAPNPDVWALQKVVFKPHIDKDTGMVRLSPQPVGTDRYTRDRSIRVPVDGEYHTIVVKDEEFAKVFNESGLPVPEVMRLVGTITRFYSLMATALNPEFIATNFLRDFQLAVARLGAENGSKLAMRVARDALPAMFGAYSGLRSKGQLTPDSGEWQRWYSRYIHAGGHVAYRGMVDTETQHQNFLVSLADAGIMPEAAKGIDKVRLRAHRAASATGAKAVARLVLDLNGAVENALRLSAFKNAIESGINEKDAAFLSRNVTVDFNLQGDASKFYGSLYMFLNANIQSNAILLRSLVNSRAFKMVALGLFFMGAGNDWWNRKRSKKTEEGRTHYDNIAPWVRQKHIIIMADGENAITIPLALGLNVFYLAGTNAMAVVDKAMTPTKAAVQTLGALVDIVNPLGSTPANKLGMLQLIAPTVIDTPVQMITNQTFAGKKIAPERPAFATPLADSANFWQKTPEHWVAVSTYLNEKTGGNEVRGGIIDLSPNMLQHFARSIFGSAGGFVSRVAEYGVAKATGEKVASKDTPFLRRFLYAPSDADLHERFHENLNNAEVAHYEVKRAQEKGNPELAKTLNEEFQPERVMFGFAQQAERRVADLRKQAAAVRNSRQLDKDQKAAAIEKLDQETAEAMMQFNRSYSERLER